MARSFNGSSQYLTCTGRAVTTCPFSVSYWMKTNGTLSGVHTVFAIGTSGYVYEIYSSSGNVAVIHGTNSGSADLYSYQTGAGPTNGVWYHVLCTLSSDDPNNWINYQNGSLGTPERYIQNSMSFPGSGNTTIASRSGGANYANVSVCDLAIYNAVLTASDALALAAGYSPLLVKRGRLAAYYKLIDADGEQDWTGSYDMTATGSPTYVKHPPIIYPSSPRLRGFRAAAGGAYDPAALDWIGQTPTRKAQAWEVVAY